MRRRQGGVCRNRGDKALCHSGTQLDRGRRMGVGWAGPGGRRDLINGSRFGPNTQLANLTKCSVSSLPLFSLAWWNVCPPTYRWRGRGRGCRYDWSARSKRWFSASFVIISCDHQLNVMRWDFIEMNSVFYNPGIISVSACDDIFVTNLITGIWACRESCL